MITSTVRATAALLAAIVLSMTLAAGSAALAASPKGQQPGGHLKISEVFVDFATEVILITGEDFDFGPGPLTVTLGDPDLIDVLPDPVTCTPDFNASPQTITCDFSMPAPGLPADGDYLLTVATGAGQSQSDEYDLTIGAVGPEGPQGPGGPPGPTGEIKIVSIPICTIGTPCLGLGPFSQTAFCPTTHPSQIHGYIGTSGTTQTQFGTFVQVGGVTSTIITMGADDSATDRVTCGVGVENADGSLIQGLLCVAVCST